MGRWINRDPIEENGGINLYVAVMNSAVNLIDSFGLQIPITISPPPPIAQGIGDALRRAIMPAAKGLKEALPFTKDHRQGVKWKPSPCGTGCQTRIIQMYTQNFLGKPRTVIDHTDEDIQTNPYYNNGGGSGFQYNRGFERPGDIEMYDRPDGQASSAVFETCRVCICEGSKGCSEAFSIGPCVTWMRHHGAGGQPRDLNMPHEYDDIDGGPMHQDNASENFQKNISNIVL